MGIALSILFFVVILVVLFRMQATLVEIQDRQKAAMRLTHQRLETIEKLFWRKREAEEPEEAELTATEEAPAAPEPVEEPQPSKPSGLGDVVESLEKKRERESAPEPAAPIFGEEEQEAEAGTS